MKKHLKHSAEYPERGEHPDHGSTQIMGARLYPCRKIKRQREAAQLSDFDDFGISGEAVSQKPTRFAFSPPI